MPGASFPDPFAERDQHWREQIRAGDSQAFDALYLAYAQPLFDRAFGILGARHDAEELVQDIFVAIWQRRAEWAVDGSVAGYLFRAVRNRAINHLRHRRVVRELEEELLRDTQHAGAVSSPPVPIDQEVAAADLETLIQCAIDELPERRRLALTFRLVHQMTFAEVGEAMGISEKAAFILVSRARDALQPLLQHFQP